MAETDITSKNVLLDLISDFETFMDKLEKRKKGLHELKDELLIYSDQEFMKSIEKGLQEAEIGATVSCDSQTAVKELFDTI